MKLVYLFTISIIICVTDFAQSYRDLEIQYVVNKVERSRIMNSVRRLDEFQTRFMLAENRFEVAGYLKTEFESMGFTDVVLDTFQCHTQIGEPYFRDDIDTITTQVHVIATLRGTETPEDIYIICGHYDSFCDDDNPFEVAPGADDNASGTACVLETARAIMRARYRPKSTLRFICFAAEELGNFGDMGSKIYANKAAQRGDNIKLVINNDMVGFTDRQLTQALINVAPNLYFHRIEEVVDVCQTYGGITYVGEGYTGGDLMGFNDVGIPGIYFEEYDFSVQAQLGYHSNMDKWYYVDYLYMTEVVKAETAVLISMNNVLSSRDEENIITKFALGQNYPNPFNPSTTITYSLRERTNVSISVFNILGEKIQELVNEEKPAGSYKIIFTADDLPSGVYFYSMNAGLYSDIKKMILVK